MIHKIHQDFLKTEDSYRECVRYWESLINDIADLSNQAGEWRRWMPLHYANKTPYELDGNPIFDCRSERLDRAIRIIQHEPQGFELEIVAWLTNYGDENVDLPSDELFINLSLSEESAEIARRLLRKWMNETTDLSEMKAYLRKIIPPTQLR